MADEMSCACLDAGPRHPDAIVERDLGVDPTEGRYADVSLIRCARCRRLWLRYQYEFEAFSRSGRWADAATIMPEAAAEFIHVAEWHLFSGSYWGHSGKRGKGPLRWN